MQGIKAGDLVLTDKFGIALVVRIIQGGTFILAHEITKVAENAVGQPNEVTEVVFDIVTDASIFSRYEPLSKLGELRKLLFGIV